MTRFRISGEKPDFTTPAMVYGAVLVGFGTGLGEIRRCATDLSWSEKSPIQ